MSKTVDSKTPDSEDAAAAQTRLTADWQAYVEDFRRAGHETVDWIAHYLNNVADMPVQAQTKPGELVDALPKSAPEKGEPYDAILHLEGIGAQLQEDNDRSRRQDHEPCTLPTEMPHEVHDAVDKVKANDQCENDVK